MKAVKKINNNVAVCIDNNGNELIAFGKGIGFRKMPYEITDLSLVERTFYGVSPEYVGLLTEIPHDVFEVASEITDEASSRIQADLNPNLVFTLADHINFAISRYKQNLNVKPPYIGSLPYLHETEYAIGQDALKLITKKFRIMLPKSEAGSIALHLINAETEVKQNEGNMDEASIIEGCIEVIEKHLNRPIDRAGFNCSRFTTHMQYLLHRIAISHNCSFPSLSSFKNCVVLPALCIKTCVEDGTSVVCDSPDFLLPYVRSKYSQYSTRLCWPRYGPGGRGLRRDDDVQEYGD